MTAGSYITEEVQVVGGQLVDRVKNLIEEGNVRHIVVRNSEREVILETPLTTGVVVGSGVVAGLLAALGGLASVLSNVNVEVRREKDKKSSKA
ncbi:MAG: DUF4342 domain-containing protein [Anaerolineae bacterium]|nr:DUF4342 domain-containing protein [Anaerolineae bacterium]